MFVRWRLPSACLRSRVFPIIIESVSYTLSEVVQGRFMLVRSTEQLPGASTATARYHGETNEHTTNEPGGTMAIEEPDMNAWLAQAKESEQAPNIGMFLIHNGIVRATPRHAVRAEAARPADAPERDARVVAVDFSYDRAGLEAALKEALGWEGVYYVQAWLNEGRVEVGESLMYVLIGADIRPHAISALEKLVGHIKSQLVEERELYA